MFGAGGGGVPDPADMDRGLKRLADSGGDLDVEVKKGDKRVQFF